MWTIFLVALIIVFAIFIFGLALIGFVIDRILTFFSKIWYKITGKRPNYSKSYRKQYNSKGTGASSYYKYSSSTSSSSEPHNQKKVEKVFTADEGEYVSFEEIKE